MKQIYLALLGILVLPLTAFANAELVQIVSFGWNEVTEQLEVLSFGSGTAIAKDLVITNKHVVKIGTQTADFLLLCPGQSQESRAVECTVAAGVSVLHNTLDVALVRTLDASVYLPSARPSTVIRSKDEIVRVVGFPIPDVNSAQGFGGTKTVEAFEAWQKNPSVGLNVKGDSPTTTRGKVIARYMVEGTGGLYTKTDAKVNFGNSGGAAFDQFGAYIGIPTLKDSAGNSYILEYAQLHQWVQERSNRNARVHKDAHTYYQSLVGTKSKTLTASSSGANISSRSRYLQQLAAKRRASGSSSGSYRTTTTRTYGSPYSRYRR